MVEVAVKKGQTVHVEFLVKSGKDIGFGLYIKKSQSETSVTSSSGKKESITSPRAMDPNTPVCVYFAFIHLMIFISFLHY